MSRFTSRVITGIIAVAVYLVYTGSYSATELLVAFITGFIIAWVMGFDLIRGFSLDSIKRLLYLVVYTIKYFTVIEARAHYKVVKAILSRKPVLKPGIVRIPYNVGSEYSIVGIANSITNTPGTVVVDVDEENKRMYVHWLFTETVSDEKARRLISKEFEEWMNKIFEKR